MIVSGLKLGLILIIIVGVIGVLFQDYIESIFTGMFFSELKETVPSE